MRWTTSSSPRRSVCGAGYLGSHGNDGKSPEHLTLLLIQHPIPAVSRLSEYRFLACLNVRFTPNADVRALKLTQLFAALSQGNSELCLREIDVTNETRQREEQLERERQKRERLKKDEERRQQERRGEERRQQERRAEERRQQEREEQDRRQQERRGEDRRQRTRRKP